VRHCILTTETDFRLGNVLRQCPLLLINIVKREGKSVEIGEGKAVGSEICKAAGNVGNAVRSGEGKAVRSGEG
jgi:hypothetical protein